MQLNLDDEGGAKELALYRISIAKEDLEAARMNFENEHYRSSNNRAYYAIFRAISACLALNFKAYKHHAQVMGNFNKDFVHTGIFPKEVSRKISRTQEVRHASDYDDFYSLKRDSLVIAKMTRGFFLLLDNTFLYGYNKTYDLKQLF